MKNKIAKNSKNHFRTVFVYAFLIFSFYNAPVEARHRFHSSFTRMDYNAKDKLVEISIQLFTHDLVPVLERQAKKNIDLEKTPDIDKLLFDYLNLNFVLRDKKGDPRLLKWVGKEIKSDVVNIYIEIPSGESFNGWSLRNSIFFESFPIQVNYVVTRYGDKKIDLYFKVGDAAKNIE